MTVRLFSSRPVRIAALLYVAYALACTQIPLLNSLGYEFSALTALLASCSAGMVTIRLLAAAEGLHDESPAMRVSVSTMVLPRAAAANTALLLPPLLIIAINALFVPNCSIAEGAAFFIVLAAVSALFGTALGFFCAVHYRHPRLMFWFFCLLMVAYTLAVGYWTPAVFSYNPLYGYFPGFTYDEALPLTGTLVLFRLLTLLMAAALVWMGSIVVADAQPGDSTTRKGLTLLAGLVGPGRRISTSGIVLAVAMVAVYRCELGFESTEEYVQRMLGGVYHTDHFTIYYAASSLSDEDLRRIGAEHEFRFAQVQGVLALTRGGSLTSYVYPSPDMKLRLIGAGNTDITKPWSGQIHLSRQSLEGSLKHELVHAAAAPFGVPVLRASLSTGLVEGLAMAVDGTWGNRTLHEYAAAMRASGIAPDIGRIMSFWGFASQHSSVSYVLAGSFCRYLIDRYGIRAMTRLYRTLDYREAYGRSLTQLIAEWNGFLSRIELDPMDSDRVDALFRRPPLFAKVCPRVLARRNADGRAAYARREYAVAESLFSETYRQGGSFEALAGLLASDLRQGNYDRVTSTLDSVVLGDDHPSRYLPLFTMIGDAYWASGDPRRASVLYDRVYHADFSAGATEAAAVRLLALNDDPGGTSYRRLFISDRGDSLRAATIDTLLGDNDAHPWLHFLQGRMFMRLGEYARALAALEQGSLEDDDAQLEAVRLRAMGECLFRLGRPAEARPKFWLSLNMVNTAAAEAEADTWVDRCDWTIAHGG